MTTETRTAQKYWDWMEIIFNDTYKDFTAHFGVSVNAQHALRDARGTPNEAEHQTHHDSWLLRRVRGCFQHHLAYAGLARYLAGHEQLGFYSQQIHFGSKHAAEFFGTNLSHARENDIARRLAEGVATPYTKGDSRFSEWLDEFDDCSVTPRFGAWMVGFDDGVSATTASGVTTNFDADQTLHLRPPARFADEISNSRIVHELDIASGFKATVVGIRPDGTRETVTDSAEGMAWQLTGQHYTDKKLPEQTRFEITFSSE